jgi:hypothetical protein
MGRISCATIVVAVVTTLAVAGCGGSTKSGSGSNSSSTAQVASQTPNSVQPGNSSPTTTVPLSRAVFITKADEICFGVNAKDRSTKIGSRETDAHNAPALGAYKEAAVAEMSKLVPPASMESTWRRIVAGAKILADDTVKLGQYAKENRGAQEISELFVGSAKAREEINNLAEQNGFKDCANY